VRVYAFSIRLELAEAQDDPADERGSNKGPAVRKHELFVAKNDADLLLELSEA